MRALLYDMSLLNVVGQWPVGGCLLFLVGVSLLI